LTEDDLSADQRAALAQLAKSALIESAATEVVSIGRTLFKDGEPSDPESQRRYRLYKALEAALAALEYTGRHSSARRHRPGSPASASCSFSLVSSSRLFSCRLLGEISVGRSGRCETL